MLLETLSQRMPSGSRCGRVALLCLSWLVACPAMGAGESTDGDDVSGGDLRPGLVAEVFDANGNAVVGARVDEQLAFRWDADPPDGRVTAGVFTMRLRGLLLAPDDG